ncbi:hypothetical protein GC197_17200 [bacterium]|nr:hypothetical protein [bacterium]
MKVQKLIIAIGIALLAMLGAELQATEIRSKLLPGEETRVKPVSLEKSDIYKVRSTEDIFGTANSCGAEGLECCGAPGCGCDSCCDLTFVAGVEATFLAPIHNGQTDFVRYNLFNNVNNNFTTGNGNSPLVPAPRIWLGATNCHGWGALVRYWQLNNCTVRNDPFTPFTTPPTLSGDLYGFSTNNSLKLYALDIEATKNFCLGCWDMQAALGYRHALLQVGDTVAFQSVISHPGGNNFYSATGASLLNFEGNGVTFGLNGIRPTCGCFDLFWSARGSVLWGNATSSSMTSAQAIGPTIAAGSTNAALGSGNDDLFIGEVQLGAQWSHWLPCANALFFFRGAFEYQYWDGVGGTTTANSFAEQTGVGGVAISTQSAGNSAINLVGFSIATGISY